ncbi:MULTISPECIES: Hcp family type VI secretion system effector [Pseudomonas syringae group]|nr:MULTISPECIES: Hcp family type VI secretion system effector [Pseudomonas syringae group]
MSILAYLTVKGKIQGLITKDASAKESVGGDYQEDHRDESILHDYHHEMTVPHDPHSGNSTGLRVHKPVRITKSFDKASPLLLQAFVQEEELEEVTIAFYRMANGIKQHYYTTTLKDARIVAINKHTPTRQASERSHLEHLQDVHFSYRDIVETHVTSNTEGSDKWGKSARG